MGEQASASAMTIVLLTIGLDNWSLGCLLVRLSFKRFDSDLVRANLTFP